MWRVSGIGLTITQRPEAVRVGLQSVRYYHPHKERDVTERVSTDGHHHWFDTEEEAKDKLLGLLRGRCANGMRLIQLAGLKAHEAGLVLPQPMQQVLVTVNTLYPSKDTP